MGSEIFEIAKWLLTPVLAGGIEMFKEQYHLEETVQAKLTKLKENLEQIAATFSNLDEGNLDEENVIASRSLQVWFWQFKDAVYLAEDVIEGFQNHLAMSSSSKARASSSKIETLLSKTIRPINFYVTNLNFKFYNDDLKQLDEVVKTLDSLVLQIGNTLAMMRYKDSKAAERPKKITPTYKSVFVDIGQADEKTTSRMRPQADEKKNSRMRPQADEKRTSRMRPQADEKKTSRMRPQADEKRTGGTKVERNKLNKIGRMGDSRKLESGLQPNGGTFPIILNSVNVISPTKLNITGRAGEKRKVLKALLRDDGSRSNLSIVSIVGPAGVGKSFLADSVFYDKESLGNRFDVKAKIFVSDDPFDIKRLTIKVIEQARLPRPKDLHQIISMTEIRRILTDGLARKRFLIVLDDVWASCAGLDDFLGPFDGAKEGSRIIITTQLESVAKAAKSDVTINLEGFKDDEDYWKLFQQYASMPSGRCRTEPNTSWSDHYPKLQQIGREIARRLDGSPLAAERIGDALKKEYSEYHWKQIANSSGKHGSVVCHLKRSYRHLPPHLKQCFLFCALFPKSHGFEKDELLQMWVALGFVHPGRGGDGGGDVGNLVDDLASRSFFAGAERLEERFVIRPLFHDLADVVGDGEFFRLDDKMKGGAAIHIPKKARNVYVTVDNLVRFHKSLREIKNLRSLVIAGGISSAVSELDFARSLEGVLTELKRLRMLIIIPELPGGDRLPKRVGNLRRLRYLEIQTIDGISRLPESFRSAYHVQSVGSKHRFLRKDVYELMNDLGYIRRDVN